VNSMIRKKASKGPAGISQVRVVNVCSVMLQNPTH
jgi:hypothetical protein